MGVKRGIGTRIDRGSHLSPCHSITSNDHSANAFEPLPTVALSSRVSAQQRLRRSWLRRELTVLAGPDVRERQLFGVSNANDRFQARQSEA